MDFLTVRIIVTVLAGLAYIVGLTGIVVPWSRRMWIAIATLVWAIVIGGWPAWIMAIFLLV